MVAVHFLPTTFTIHHPVPLVRSTELRLVATIHAVRRTLAATVVTALPQVHHPVTLVLRRKNESTKPQNVPHIQEGRPQMGSTPVEKFTEHLEQKKSEPTPRAATPLTPGQSWHQVRELWPVLLFILHCIAGNASGCFFRAKRVWSVGVRGRRVVVISSFLDRTSLLALECHKSVRPCCMTIVYAAEILQGCSFGVLSSGSSESGVEKSGERDAA